MLKKLLIAFFVLMASATHAQLNNQWIDYGKTYYKFKLAKDTLCRIPQSAISAVGLAGVPANQFQLWRNGAEVRLYTSVNTDPLGPTDYIEFWGQMNDGKADNQLYLEPDFQLADKYSLETDTACYFLTVNPAGGNLRFTTTSNPSPGAGTPDAYYMRNMDFAYKNQINRGRAEIVGEYIYSASYDKAEGWASNTIAPGFDLTKEIFNLNVYTAGPANGLTVRVNAAGTANNQRNLKIKLFNTEITTGPYSSPIDMSLFSYKKANITNLPLTLLPSTSYLIFTVADAAIGTNTTNDRIVVSSLGLTFPATFNFNNERYFSFDLAPSASGNYLEIDNFNYGSTAPVLYDMTSGARYVADINSNPGKVRFVLPASTEPVRNFRLVNQESYQPITSFTQRNFLDLSNPNNQGNYVIISNPVLYNDGSGNNYVDQYRQYRNSVQGGSFNAKVYDIGELTDQFGFGIANHPGSIRDFIRYSKTLFSDPPQYVFLIGRAVDYNDQKDNEGNPQLNQLNLVPTFGWPASDGLLAALPGTFLPIVPMGRLGAISGGEVNNYLQKVIQYEHEQQTPSPYIVDKGWMKDFMHIVGGKDTDENNAFTHYMSDYAKIVRDTLYGGYVETFTKSSTGAVQQASSDRIVQLINGGLGFIGYFGHSSANTFEFNLSNPEIYNNAGKYPFFNVSGCDAGNFFIFDPLRLTGNLSISEKYVLANQRGSIGFLADTHFGIPQILDPYNTALYTAFAKTMYGNTIGNQMVQTIQSQGGADHNLNYYTRIHIEELTLHGDPAIKLNAFPKPDYVIEDQNVKITPSIITVADANFHIKVKLQNLGRAIGDSIWVTVKRKLPNDTIVFLYNKLIPGIHYSDSLETDVVITPTTDKGLNQLIITVDDGNRVDELYETNNTLTKDFYIFEDELRPTSPYNFSIVNQQNITFFANTADPLSGIRQYTMEIDTTELFNSPFKKIYNQSGAGGIVEFTPTNLTFTDSTVYYWRVAMTPTSPSATLIWNGFSFIYLPTSSTGFNQSHYYQHLKSTYSDITLDEDRKFHFKRLPRNLIFRTGIYPYYSAFGINVDLDIQQLEIYGCKYGSIQVYVFDSTTLQPWRNHNVDATHAQFGSWPVCQNTATMNDPTRAFFEFPYNDPIRRKAAIDFITDSIPAGKYVAITNLGYTGNTSFINEWQQDQATLGTGHSLYHTLKSIGFTQIDSFYHNLPFLYFYQKGMPGFAPTQVMGPDDTTHIDESFTLRTISTTGTIQSVNYGPARAWTSMHWRGFSVDPDPQTDSVTVEVWGVKVDGHADSLKTVAPARDTSLSFVNATTYPYLRLVMHNSDRNYITPYQLRYLRVNADLVPEGAVAPGILFSMKDSVVQGEPIDLKIAFKNISMTAFDSLLAVKLIIKDRNNVDHLITVPKRKALVAGDTLLLNYTIDTKQLPGNNTLSVDFNPDNDQPEQYHYNNILFKDFHVTEDKFNPLLDVTFDGIHILNQDIVSAKPHILIKLKDESRFLELKDTSSIKLQVRYPDQSLHTYYFGDTMRFTPANLATGQNTASIDFTPSFLSDDQSDDGMDYELIVTGKDAVGNKAGDLDYHISFKIINKPMISNLFNYPNPFTTSTAFVFTLTGTEVPNMRIQILTITGKVVKEISRAELGNVHIGTNITDYKWDGTDMFGQKLANGVYIYRVISSLHGKSLEKYQTMYGNGNNTNKLFNKGYGKMYLMR